MCAILRIGDIETYPWPFGDSADEACVVGESDSPINMGPILADLARFGESISNDDVVVEILAPPSDQAGLDDMHSEPARGSNDPAPSNHAPMKSTFKHRYAIFGKTALTSDHISSITYSFVCTPHFPRPTHRVEIGAPN